jgi:hypothetical protein
MCFVKTLLIPISFIILDIILVSSFVFSLSALQCGQILLTNLWAIIVSKAEANIYGFNHILTILSNVSAADFVCKVDKTKCHVRDA